MNEKKIKCIDNEYLQSGSVEQCTICNVHSQDQES